LLFFQYLISDNQKIDISALNYDELAVNAFISGMCITNKNYSMAAFLSLMSFFESYQRKIIQYITTLVKMKAFIPIIELLVLSLKESDASDFPNLYN
jgi:hypothetical protein